MSTYCAGGESGRIIVSTGENIGFLLTHLFQSLNQRPDSFQR
ncbi:MAG: hypothetical protein P8171_20575 [Candidatus Thiodiazotropha sp.]